MQNFCLKFPDEQTAFDALSAYRITEPAGDTTVTNWVTGSHTHALDVIGTIHKPTGTMLTDEEGNQYPEMAPLDGFHINFLVDELPEALAPYVVVPTNPVRVFA